MFNQIFRDRCPVNAIISFPLNKNYSDFVNYLLSVCGMERCIELVRFGDLLSHLAPVPPSKTRKTKQHTLQTRCG